MDFVAQLKNLPKTQEFFVGIDSDGCVFDTMEIKHKECFCPAYIKHFGLQSASRFAREVWEFVNLYSKTRGCNRFLAVQRCFSLMSNWHVFADRGVPAGGNAALDGWIERESKLGEPALEVEVARTGDADLKRFLAWSREVNERIADMVEGVPPFPSVPAALEKMEGQADRIVVSQTPFEALEREWQEHGIARHVTAIAGQEAGKKSEHIAYAAGDGKYDADKMLMIGDAPGDYRAADANGALFFPVLPGKEEESWQRLLNEGLDRFFGGTYAGAYQKALMDEFDAVLPEDPAWS